jgi:hypothetical protein
MAFGSNGLNTPKVQQHSIAVRQAQDLATQVYNNADKAEELAKIEKAKADFEKKLSEENKTVFTKVFEAKSIILAANAAAEKKEAVEATTAATQTEKKEAVEATTSATQTAAPEKCEKLAAAEKELAEILETTKPETRTSSYWLIFTYLILTFAELLLSPMGISFVSKVAPPKYKGMMMGGWFVATAIGNMLVAVGGFLWGGIPLTIVWSVFIGLCLLSALFMFVMMKRLESATK